jgi:hypothetical protein
VFGGHLRQIRSYALHRGFFARKFPATSLKASYFVPSAFTLFAFAGWLPGLVCPSMFTLWASVMTLYAVLALLFSLKTIHPIGIMGILAGTFLTHITYGTWFVAGLAASELAD